MPSRPRTYIYWCCYRGLSGYVDVEADVTPTPLFHATCHHDPGHTSTGAALEVVKVQRLSYSSDLFSGITKYSDYFIKRFPKISFGVLFIAFTWYVFCDQKSIYSRRYTTVHLRTDWWQISPGNRKEDIN